MSRPRRVLWLMPEYPPDAGGIATFAAATVPDLLRRGHEIHVVSTQAVAPSRDVVDDVEVVREPFRSAFEDRSPVAIAMSRRRLAELKAAIQPDLYHLCPTDPTPVLHLLTAETAPAPMVLTLQNELLDLLPVAGPDTLIARLVDAAAVITAVSGTIALQIARLVPSVAYRVVTIPNAVPIEVDPRPLPGSKQLLAVGRLIDQKGFDRLIPAMVEVAARHPDVKLDILGEGPNRTALQRLIGEAGLDDVVVMRGHVGRADVHRLLDEAQVVVSPSRHEGLSFAVLEAAVHARPVVGSRIGGTDEVVEHGVTGLLVDRDQLDRDPTALAEAICVILDDPELAQAMGTAARQRIERRFSVTVATDVYEMVYRRLTTPPADVAIVIPAHNAERLLPFTLESLLADVATTDLTVQVIVVDDGSTDDTERVIGQFASRGVDYFGQPHLGMTAARNAGIALTSSRYIAHFDVDDLWPAGRLAGLHAALERDTEVDAVFGAAVEFVDPDAPPNTRWSGEPRIVRTPCAGLLRRSVHDRFGGFGDTASTDQLGWSAMALASGLRYVTVDDVVLERRIHAGNSSHGAPFTHERSRVAAIKRSLDARRSAPA